VRELIRQDQERQSLRTKLLDGAASPLTEPVDKAYFARLKSRAHGNRGTRGRR
jgi:antitoxin ParD1/3/4